MGISYPSVSSTWREFECKLAAREASEPHSEPQNKSMGSKQKKVFRDSGCEVNLNWDSPISMGTVESQDHQEKNP